MGWLRESKSLRVGGSVADLDKKQLWGTGWGNF
jgi:hypothetical protein